MEIASRNSIKCTSRMTVHMMLSNGTMWQMVYCIMLPLMTVTLLSVYCLFYYVVWHDLMLVNVTFVYHFLSMDSEND